jgi:hypothetical protein
MRIKRTAAMVAAPIAVAGGVALGSSPASAAVTPGAATPAAADTHCAYSGYTCFYVNAGWGGEEGKVAGNNSNFTKLARNGGGTWNDVISSATNAGNSDMIAFYQNAGNHNGVSYCLTRGYESYGASDFVDINFNDEASADFWFASTSANLFNNCDGWDSLSA